MACLSRMPRKPAWIHRLDTVLDELYRLPAPILDSAAIAKLFAVSPRHARRILGDVLELPAGRSLVVTRADLIDKLHRLQADPAHREESRRMQRVARQIDALREHAQARQIPIRRRPPGIPSTVDLEPGRLEIRFASGAELLEQLLQLAQRIAGDFQWFEEVTKPSPPS